MPNVCTGPHLRVLAELYPDLLAAAVQRPARDAELRGGLLDRHPAPDGLQRSVEVILGSEVSVSWHWQSVTTGYQQSMSVVSTS